MATSPDEPPQPDAAGRPDDAGAPERSETPEYTGAPELSRQPEDAEQPEQAPEKPSGRRRSGILIGAIAAVVLVAGAIALLVRGGAEDAPPEPAAPEAARTEQEEPAEEAPAAAQPGAGEEELPEIWDGDLRALIDQSVAGLDHELDDDLAEVAEEDLPEGAVQAVTGTYTDGEQEVDLTAALFADHEAEAEHAADLLAAAETDGATVTAEGPRYHDDTGHFWLLDRGDDVMTALWRTDSGVVLTLDGPAEEVVLLHDHLSI